MKILTQGKGGLKGFHGYVGDKTNMCDSFGNPLSVGDVVITSNQDDFSKKNRYLGNEYGIAFVCEEKTNIANWTNENKQYIMGIADIWNDTAFSDYKIDFTGDYWDALYALMDGWIVHKIKDFKDVVDGERIEFLYVEELGQIKSEF